MNRAQLPLDLFSVKWAHLPFYLAWWSEHSGKGPVVIVLTSPIKGPVVVVLSSPSKGLVVIVLTLPSNGSAAILIVLTSPSKCPVEIANYAIHIVNCELTTLNAVINFTINNCLLSLRDWLWSGIVFSVSTIGWGRWHVRPQAPADFDHRSKLLVGLITCSPLVDESSNWFCYCHFIITLLE